MRDDEVVRPEESYDDFGSVGVGDGQNNDALCDSGDPTLVDIDAFSFRVGLESPLTMAWEGVQSSWWPVGKHRVSTALHQGSLPGGIRLKCQDDVETSVIFSRGARQLGNGVTEFGAKLPGLE